MPRTTTHNHSQRLQSSLHVNKENSPATTTTTTTTTLPPTSRHLKSPYSREKERVITVATTTPTTTTTTTNTKRKTKKRSGYAELSRGGKPKNEQVGGKIGIGNTTTTSTCSNSSKVMMGNEIIKKKTMVPLRLPRVRIDPIDQENLNKECHLNMVSRSWSVSLSLSLSPWIGYNHSRRTDS